jgi:hypothetical protein
MMSRRHRRRPQHGNEQQQQSQPQPQKVLLQNQAAGSFEIDITKSLTRFSATIADA